MRYKPDPLTRSWTFRDMNPVIGGKNVGHNHVTIQTLDLKIWYSDAIPKSDLINTLLTFDLQMKMSMYESFCDKVDHVYREYEFLTAICVMDVWERRMVNFTLVRTITRPTRFSHARFLSANLGRLLTWPNKDDQMNMSEICEHDWKLDNDEP